MAELRLSAICHNNERMAPVSDSFETVYKCALNLR